VLHDFNGGDAVGTDGSFPSGGLIFDSAGNLYGATAGAGVYGYGTVCEIARQPQHLEVHHKQSQPLRRRFRREFEHALRELPRRYPSPKNCRAARHAQPSPPRQDSLAPSSGLSEAERHGLQQSLCVCLSSCGRVHSRSLEGPDQTTC